MKFFISASVLSVMVFYSSLLPFLHSVNLNFSSTIHKNYMFLLCNGILVFIVRNSISNSERNGQKTEALEAVMVEDCRKVEDGKEMENGSVLEGGEESEILILEKEEEKGLIFVEEEENDDYYYYEEEEEEEEEEMGILSKEELNKKCEEFIRRMKAGIKFESKQVLGILSKEELNKKCEEFIRRMKAEIKFES